MRIKFTSHGSDRLLERGVSRDDVIFVLEHYTLSVPAHKGGVKYTATLTDGRRLSVVLVRPLDVSKTNVVKTVHPVD